MNAHLRRAILVILAMSVSAIPARAADEVGASAAGPQAGRREGHRLPEELARGPTAAFRARSRSRGRASPPWSWPPCCATATRPTIPMVANALKYLEGQVKKDGGIYDKGLANYITSVALMALSEANQGGKYDTIIKNADQVPQGAAVRRRRGRREVRRRRLRQRGQGSARPVQHAALPRRPAGGRRAEGRPGRAAGCQVHQPLPEPARRDQRPAVRQEDDRRRQGRPDLPSRTRTTSRTRRPTAACARWAA